MPPMPTSRSRVVSRSGSRPVSPTMSIRSRKSVISTSRSKRRNSYLDPELTDDEDSEDDRRSQRSGFLGPRRTRRISTTSQSYEEDFIDSRAMKIKNNKDRKCVQSEVPQRRSSATQITTKPTSTDSPITPESESESQTTKAMVQAKIREKINANIQKVVPPIENRLNSVDEESHRQLDEEPKTEQPSRESSGDKDSLGPPPSTPDHEWECEFCTFVNDPRVKICVVCCKTPTKRPVEHLLNEPTDQSKKMEQKTKASNVEEKMEVEVQKKSGRRKKRISFWLGTNKVN